MAPQRFGRLCFACEQRSCRALLTGGGRGGQRERAALRVPAHGPAIAGMDDRAAELADALECRGHVGDGEVGQGGGVAGARSTLVDSEGSPFALAAAPAPPA